MNKADRFVFASVLVVASVICGGWQSPQEPPATEPDGPLRMGGKITRPEKISGPNPGYTASARARGIQGVVIVEAIIDKNGDVTHVRILKPLEESLDRSVMHTIRKWKFKPATLDGEAVDVYYNLTVSLSLGLGAGLPTGSQKRKATALANWKSRLEKLRKRMGAGDWKAASTISKKLAVEMANQIADSSGKPMVASVITYHALSQAALGLDEDALWHWQIAQNLDSRLASAVSLADFGAAGALLGANPPRRASEMPGVTAVFRQADGVSPPKPLDWPFPKAPRELKDVWAADLLEVELLVDETGRVSAPVVLKGQLAGKIYLGLLAMRQWRFEPALSEGEPVATLLRVTVTDEPQMPQGLHPSSSQNK